MTKTKRRNKMDKQNDKPIYIQVSDNDTEWQHNLSLLKDPSFITN